MRVRRRSDQVTTLRPSGSGANRYGSCGNTSSPCAARSSSSMIRPRKSDSVYAPGDARTPGHSSSVTQAPPTISRRSNTSTDNPARARYAAATSPLWPAPTTTASGTWPFDLRAAVHDDGQSCRTRPGGRILIDHAQLHPDSAGADRDRLVHMCARELRAPEDVHHLDRLADRGQIREALLAEDLPGAGTRIDRANPLAARLEKCGDAV